MSAENKDKNYETKGPVRIPKKDLKNYIKNPNCVKMRQSFHANGYKPNKVFQNFEMDQIPYTAYLVMRQYLKIQIARLRSMFIETSKIVEQVFVGIIPLR